jgi:UDP-N-acetylmuramyl pentapeptide phosphotransferase/UDP-N-acetylglucosamine-1-phosphate transferase
MTGPDSTDETGDSMIHDWWPAGLAALCAAALMPLAIHNRWLGHDTDFKGVQKVHDVSTSRLGGLNVFVAYFAVLCVAVQVGNAALSQAFPLLLCAVPVVLVGVWEDITRGLHPWHRLAGAVASGALASWFAMGIIARVDLPLLDGWLGYLVFALPLTWFMVAGACNAINLIDGAHGLAGGTALMMFGGLAAAAGIAGDALVLAQSLAMMGAIVGFLVWNYPRGKVFLGDAGAYFIGFMYAELSIQIIARNPGISAWFVIALAAYPIVETAYSIYRRKLVLRTASMQPDAGHLHSLTYRHLVLRGQGVHRGEAVKRANAQVAPRLWLHGAICFVVAIVLRESTPALIGFALLYAVGYVACYRALARERRDDPPTQTKRPRAAVR